MPNSTPCDDLLVPTRNGLYCPAGDFHVDPWRPVDRAVVTHGHADHARRGTRHVLTAKDGVGILERRIGGEGTTIEGVAPGERLAIGDATVSLHPAGHVLGSAQVRIEVGGRTWVFSGDYATEANPTCAPFEPVRCHRFITECTFGLPLYRWDPPAMTGSRLRSLVRGILAEGRTALIGAYGLGKAQRLIAMLGEDGGVEAPIVCHGAVETMNEAYRAAGVSLPETTTVKALAEAGGVRPVVAIGPPSVIGGPWTKRFQPTTSILASGWMALRGRRRRTMVDEAVVLSDHVDWPGLLSAVAETGCEEVGLTHGFVEPCARWFEEQGLHSVVYRTRFEGEDVGERGEEPA